MTSPTGRTGLPFCDYNAGAPADAEVLARFVEVERACPANPSSTHGPGRRARAELEAARGRIAAALGVDADDVLFTSGTTESANLAVLGLGDPALPVLLGPGEHPAVYEAAAARGAVLFSIDREGSVLVQAPPQPVALIAVGHAQSELGTVQPIAAVLALGRQLGVPVFVDAAQTLGRLPLDEVLAGAAAVALSPHKCGGLRGHGVLVGRGLAARLRPLLRGGGQEQGLRPGTQSPALAAANALAIERAVATQPARAAAMRAGGAALRAGLAASGVAGAVLTPPTALPNTLLVHFSGVDGRTLLPALDLAGVHASHGSACSAGAPRPPRILTALGLDEAAARACVRFSWGPDASADGLAAVGRRAGEVVAALQKKNSAAEPR